MKQSPRFVPSALPMHTCKLKKIIYGLKQVGQPWFHQFSRFLLSYGLVCSHADPSIFIACTDSHIFVLLHVNDNCTNRQF